MIGLAVELNIDKCFSPQPEASQESESQPEQPKRIEDVPLNCLLFADKHKLAQVTRNLLSNALKFTSEGGDVLVRVSFLSPQNSQLKVTGSNPNPSPNTSSQSRLAIFREFSKPHSSILRSLFSIGSRKSNVMIHVDHEYSERIYQDSNTK